MNKHMIALLRPMSLCAAALAAALLSPAHAKDTSIKAADLTVQPVPEDAKQISRARPALWKVADEDTTIYLFGTVHVLPEGIEWFDGKVADAFAESTTLVTEVGDADPSAMPALVIKLASLPNKEKLRPLLSSELRSQYETALTTYGIPLLAFDRFKPWYAAISLATLPLMKEGYSLTNGVDSQLTIRAKERAIELKGLETPEFQLSLFDNLPQETQKRYLADVVKHLPDVKEQIATMVDAWKSGDADGLAEIINEEQPDPTFTKVLLTDRNATWAKWLHKRLDQPGSVFVAVGAGHLAGTGSVQDQLAAKGIQTTRIQ